MHAISQFFSLPGLWLFFVAACLAATSGWLLFNNREKAGVFLLWLAAFVVRLFTARLDPFLHNWDEKFHALVARNMMDHPLTPMLRVNPIAPYNKFEWCCNHIWLHKQPLFMWQMALSIKLFGVSEMSARYPSILMGSLMVVMVYSIAKSMLGDKVVAFFAAVMFCFCNYQLELISGYNGTDHNDIANGFYVLASIWAYQQYLKERSIKFVMLIGLFAGCAVLNKWLLGLVVFSGWGVNMLFAAKDTTILKQLLHFVSALLLACVVFIPWQLYILHTFPEEAHYVYGFNSRHITEQLEGHSGSIFYYVRQLPVYFGWVVLPLLGCGLYTIVKRAMQNPRNRQMEVMWITVSFLVMLFFSLVVKTKWPPYVFLVAPFGFICIAACARAIERRFKLKVLLPLLIISASVSVFKPGQLALAHNPTDPYRIAKINNTIIYKHLKSDLPANVKLVLNTVSFEDIDLMFYNGDINAYSWTLHPGIIDSLEAAKVPFAVFKPHGLYGTPAEIINYPGVFIINKELKE